jgi:ABC-2 type transport system permease protein
MSLVRPTLLLTVRALVQFPRLPAVLVFSMIPPIVQFLIFGSLFSGFPEQIPDFPTDNYYEYIAPAVVFFTAVIGIANAGMALVNDFQSGYFQKILLAPVNMWAVLLGRLLSDGVRVYLQAGVILLLALLFGGRVETGVLGALLMLALATLFAIFTVGVIVANVALTTKSDQAVQSIFPVFFILIFLTTAFLPKEAIGSETLKTIIDFNPAEYVVSPMQELMFGGWAWGEIGFALAIIAGFAVLGVALTRLNYRSVYS